MKIDFKTTQDGISARLGEIISRTQGLSTVLRRNVFPIYVNAQIERWNTEGASEKLGWKPLNRRYAEYKVRKFGGGPKFRFFPSMGGRNIIGTYSPSYPGGGTKMMIATNRLIDSVIGKTNKYHKRIISNKGMTISTTVPYAKHADENRTFSKWSPETTKRMLAPIMKYIARGDR